MSIIIIFIYFAYLNVSALSLLHLHHSFGPIFTGTHYFINCFVSNRMEKIKRNGATGAPASSGDMPKQRQHTKTQNRAVLFPSFFLFIAIYHLARVAYSRLLLLYILVHENQQKHCHRAKNVRGSLNCCAVKVNFVFFSSSSPPFSSCFQLQVVLHSFIFDSNNPCDAHRIRRKKVRKQRQRDTISAQIPSQ